jgi:hypothetical protein
MRKAVLFLMAAAVLPAQTAQPALTLQEKEDFLLNAKLIRTHGVKKGVTATVRATLSDGKIVHDASIQMIDEEKQRFQTARGLEINFRDCYKFNIAAYRLGLMLGLGDVIPPSVERRFDGHPAAWTWWIEDVQMDEMEKVKVGAEPPDHDKWARQYQVMKIFDQLIYNTDRNQTNILYDKDWKLWMIDHTRAFRTSKALMDPKGLERCDRQLLAAMKLLNEADLKKELSKYIRPAEIAGILARRDKLVAYFEGEGAKLMYDYLPAPVSRRL